MNGFVSLFFSLFFLVLLLWSIVYVARLCIAQSGNVSSKRWFYESGNLFIVVFCRMVLQIDNLKSILQTIPFWTTMVFESAYKMSQNSHTCSSWKYRSALGEGKKSWHFIVRMVLFNVWMDGCVCVFVWCIAQCIRCSSRRIE